MRNSFGGWSEVAQRFRYSNSIRPQFTCGLKDLRPALQQLAIFGYFKPEIRPAKLAARRVRGGSAKLPKFLHIPFARFFQLRADPPANRLHASGGFPRAAARDSSRGAPGCCAATRDHPRQRRGRGQLPHPGCPAATASADRPRLVSAVVPRLAPCNHGIVFHNCKDDSPPNSPPLVGSHSG